MGHFFLRVFMARFIKIWQSLFKLEMKASWMYFMERSVAYEMLQIQKYDR